MGSIDLLSPSWTDGRLADPFTRVSLSSSSSLHHSSLRPSMAKNSYSISSMTIRRSTNIRRRILTPRSSAWTQTNFISIWLFFFPKLRFSDSMGSRSILNLMTTTCLCFCIIESCSAGIQSIGKIYPDLQGSQMNWIDKNGIFLLSNSSNFGFGFAPSQDNTLFFLAIVHIGSSRIVWSANRNALVQNSDPFVFDRRGNAYLQRGEKVVWSTESGGEGVSAMELLDSGNLVMYGNGGKLIWQSFSHPTDTLLMNQEFVRGMKLVSNGDAENLKYVLEFIPGDLVLSADYRTRQKYWSIERENRKIINKDNGGLSSAFISANSWRFYGRERQLLSQFIFTDASGSNSTSVAVLGSDGFITFFSLENDGTSTEYDLKIPGDPCATPQPCGKYYICLGGNMCQCPSSLSSSSTCSPAELSSSSSCGQSRVSNRLIDLGGGIDYFGIDFAHSASRTDLESCKRICLANCSCIAVFYEKNSRECFIFDSIGSLRTSSSNSSVVSFIKTVDESNNGIGNHLRYVVAIVVSTVLVIFSIVFIWYRCYSRKRLVEDENETSEEDNFLKSLSAMPIRFAYRDLQIATDNFSMKLGQGGFGSVYKGVLSDGTQLAVKKLEGIGQGKKEFRAEVSIIGGIHHIHLVKLKGFCAEGTHRLLAYEYMANGSLDKWIFKRKPNDFYLDWNARFNIALGTAKGLAYLHEDCDSKIVHCDVKPENVLLDENFVARVSDFGLAKLMTREQSHVFTTLRGTRGYLAPEWITNYAISEKSDVYSYGMVLLEILGGRKNFDPKESYERSYFPSFAFRMLEEGNLSSVLDSKLDVEKDDERVMSAIKAALWCIQEDVNLRPSMTKVVQMLEGLVRVPQPPFSSHTGARLYSSFYRSISSSEEGTSSGPSDSSNSTCITAVRLSGPR